LTSDCTIQEKIEKSMFLALQILLYALEINFTMTTIYAQNREIFKNIFLTNSNMKDWEISSIISLKH